MRAGDFPWILDLDSWSLFGTLNLIWAAPRRLDHVAAAAEPTSRYRPGRFSIRPRGTISRRRHQIAVNLAPKFTIPDENRLDDNDTHSGRILDLTICTSTIHDKRVQDPTSQRRPFLPEGPIPRIPGTNPTEPSFYLVP